MALIDGLFAGMLAGCPALRDVEALTDEMGNADLVDEVIATFRGANLFVVCATTGRRSHELRRDMTSSGILRELRRDADDCDREVQ